MHQVVILFPFLSVKFPVSMMIKSMSVHKPKPPKVKIIKMTVPILPVIQNISIYRVEYSTPSMPILCKLHWVLGEE